MKIRIYIQTKTKVKQQQKIKIKTVVSTELLDVIDIILTMILLHLVRPFATLRSSINAVLCSCL